MHVLVRTASFATIVFLLASCTATGNPERDRPEKGDLRIDHRQIAYLVASDVMNRRTSVDEAFAFARAVVVQRGDANKWLHVFWSVGVVPESTDCQIEFMCWLVDHGGDPAWLPRWLWWGDPLKGRLFWDEMRIQHADLVDQYGMLGTWRRLYPEQLTSFEVEDVAIAEAIPSYYVVVRQR